LRLRLSQAGKACLRQSQSEYTPAAAASARPPVAFFHFQIKNERNFYLKMVSRISLQLMRETSDGEHVMKRLFSFLKRHSIYTISIIGIFLLFLGGIGIFYISMQRIADKALENELLVMAGTIKMRLANSIIKELALTLKMADSELIKRYFKYPDDTSFKEIAFEEFASYGRSFTNNSVYWVNDQDKIFYIDNIAYYTLDQKSPEALMYNMTMYHTEKYNFSINYNHISSSLDLWLNVPVYDNNTSIGVLGTYFDLKNFINELYNNINIKSDMYTFNRFIEITLARDTEIAEKKVYITDCFPDITPEITQFLDQSTPQETRIYNRAGAKYILSYVPLLDWYVAGRLPGKKQFSRQDQP
jgi:methyl-accepting chemotaxis protein